MNAQTQKAFTIIEVLLFLAITGALSVGILVGSSAVIGQQRYRDSVHSFKGHLQEQYSHVTNVINGEPTNPVCVESGDTLMFDTDSSNARGTSDCLVIGRFVLVEPAKVTTHNLIGQPGEDSEDGGDSAVLRGYGLSLRDSESRDIAWGARIVRPGTSDGMTTSILIARSPISGSIITYVEDGDHTATIKDMIDGSNMTQKDFCVDSGGVSGMRSQMAVRINARASSQSAVEIPVESDGVCG